VATDEFIFAVKLVKHLENAGWHWNGFIRYAFAILYGRKYFILHLF